MLMIVSDHIWTTEALVFQYLNTPLHPTTDDRYTPSVSGHFRSSELDAIETDSRWNIYDSLAAPGVN